MERAAVADLPQPAARVQEYVARFDSFVNDEVRPIEDALDTRVAGTPAQPRHDADGRMHPALWEARRQVQRRAGALGLYAPHIAAGSGGSGFTRVEMHHVQEHVYRTCGLGLGLAALAWTEGPYPALERIAPALRDEYVLPAVRGEKTLAFANTEHAVGSDVFAMTTTAIRDGDDWVISGRKAWITNAHFADFALVVAVTDPMARSRSLSMFVVDADSPGFRRGPDIPTMMDDGLTGELEFDAVRVPARHMVGELGDGFALALQSINWRRLDRGGMCAGWGRWLVGRAVEYAGRRRTGGRPISEHQAIRHHIARMDLDVYQARATSLAVQGAVDTLDPFATPVDPAVPRLVSLLKVSSDEAFFRVCDSAVQVRGGVGLLRGSPEEKLFRVARNLRIPAGTSEIQLNAISRALIGNAS